MATSDVLLICPAARHGKIIGAAPADVESRDDVDPIATVGGLYAAPGKLYLYVKFDDGVGNVAAAAGKAAYIDTIASWDPDTGSATVTSDVSDASPANAAAVVVGVFVNVITDGRYGFIQCGGIKTGVLNTATAAGDRLIASTTDGSLALATAGGDIVEYVGIAIAAAA